MANEGSQIVDLNDVRRARDKEGSQLVGGQRAALSEEIAMSEPPSREEIEAKIAAVEARTDTKFERLIGGIEKNTSALMAEIGKHSLHINARLDAVEKSTGGVKATIIVTAVAVLALLVGILGYGQQWFGIGVTTRDIIRATVAEMGEKASKPSAQPLTPSVMPTNPQPQSPPERK